jgi:hypothetical protein
MAVASSHQSHLGGAEALNTRAAAKALAAWDDGKPNELPTPFGNRTPLTRDGGLPRCTNFLATWLQSPSAHPMAIASAKTVLSQFIHPFRQPLLRTAKRSSQPSNESQRSGILPMSEKNAIKSSSQFLAQL